MYRPNVFKNMPESQLVRMAEDPVYKTAWEELEIMKCRDPKTGFRHFIKNYGVHLDATGEGPKGLDLWDYQDDIFVELLQNSNEDYDVLKPRRCGFTLIYAHYALWKAGIREDTPAARFLIISIGQKEAQEVLATIRNINYCLPEFLRVSIGADKSRDTRNRLSRDSQTVFTFPDRDGAQIQSLPCTGTTGRSLTASDVLLDELAHYPKKLAKKVVGSVQSVTEGGGRVITGSTANAKVGDGEEFYRRWTEANEDPDMIAVFIPYHLRPGRDDEWKKRMIKKLGEAVFMQEYPANPEEAFSVNSEKRAFPINHVYSVWELGAEMDELWNKKETYPLDNAVIPGIDWGRHSTSCNTVDTPGNIIYVRSEVTTESLDAETFSRKAISEAEKVGDIEVIWQDAANHQQAMSLRKVCDEQPYKIKTRRVAFKGNKQKWVEFVRLLMRRTHDGEETTKLAISNNCPTTFKQLLEAEIDDEGKIDKINDHNRDAFFCSIHPHMNRYYKEEARKRRKDKTKVKKQVNNY